LVASCPNGSCIVVGSLLLLFNKSDWLFVKTTTKPVGTRPTTTKGGDKKKKFK
jgi:hypothetical protein